VVWILYRREEEEEEEPETTTQETQTETTDDLTESFETVSVRDEVIPTVHLHPVPKQSPVRKPPPKRFATTTMPVTIHSHPEPLERFSTDDIEARLHSHGTGTKNVPPG